LVLLFSGFEKMVIAFFKISRSNFTSASSLFSLNNSSSLGLPLSGKAFKPFDLNSLLHRRKQTAETPKSSATSFAVLLLVRISGGTPVYKKLPANFQVE